jgi:E3 ubiquitin-protein ligase SspH2
VSFSKYLPEKNEINKKNIINKMVKFKINKYLKSLPKDTEIIDVSHKELKYLPDLTRFKKLKVLVCYNNYLTKLPKLNDSLEGLYCQRNQITELPDLNNNLYELHCSNNQIIELPSLNENLEVLYCNNNKLTKLPILNKNLGELCCSNNQITELPCLTENLKELYFYNNKVKYFQYIEYELYQFEYHMNPIHKILFELKEYGDDFIELKNKINKLNDFRYLYYSLKCKKKLITWLWKVRTPMIIKKYHPIYLHHLTEDDNLDEILEAW